MHLDMKSSTCLIIIADDIIHKSFQTSKKKEEGDDFHVQLDVEYVIHYVFQQSII